MQDTPYHHCVFLCGEDKLTAQNYGRMRKWGEDRLLFLAIVFAIESSLLNHHPESKMNNAFCSRIADATVVPNVSNGA